MELLLCVVILLAMINIVAPAWPLPERESLFVKDTVKVLTRGELPECPTGVEPCKEVLRYPIFYDGDKMTMYRQKSYSVSTLGQLEWWMTAYFHFAALYCCWYEDDKKKMKYKTHVIIAAHNRLKDKLGPDVILDTISFSGETYDSDIKKVIQASIRPLFSPPDFANKKQTVYFKHNLENTELTDTDKEKCSKLTYSFDLTEHFNRGKPTEGATLTEKCKAIAGLIKKYQYESGRLNSWLDYSIMNCAEPEPMEEEVDCKEVSKAITLVDLKDKKTW
ncbi:uncharacterized protein LOC129003237 isoform X1 [Macrosteles quadrilineatus]|uniref:uncharacterized protein LOC129003237 isoform X1 n=1 Tax=Macrosteles quadrilineatus TaxID=74068 RepID=UPI0023E2B3FB|nr:uncharacterized protein LOC129003237 isoform X1 [Macrosteles quadrilineatus]